MHNSLPIAVYPASESSHSRRTSQALADELGLPLVSSVEHGPKYLLAINDERIELRSNPYHEQQHKLFSPFSVDFLSGSSGYRHAHNCTTKQPLAKAVGIRPGFRPTIIDATAGLGGDGFVLACLGCQVHLVERSPILFVLLRDGLRRASLDPRTAEIINTRMHLTLADARTFLADSATQPYTIYLDPMYPHTNKSALNKKEMRIIRDLVGDDLDGIELLDIALRSATNRVVVKRPKGAEYLGHHRPAHEITMKNSRFDVYLTAHL